MGLKERAAELLRKYQEIEPDIGAADHSPCVDSWLCGWHKYVQDGIAVLTLTPQEIHGIYHTLLAALARNNRLTAERDAALARVKQLEEQLQEKDETQIRNPGGAPTPA